MINAIKLYKLSNFINKKGFKFISKKIDTLNIIFNKCVLYGCTDIDVGFSLGYGGIGVVVHKDSIIGKNCTISQNVTIGRKKGRNDGVPKIGDNVYIGPNSVIIGNIEIGHNCIIGPCTFLNKSVPSNSIVVGNPGKVVRRISTDNYMDYSLYNIDYEKL